MDKLEKITALVADNKTEAAIARLYRLYMYDKVAGSTVNRIRNEFYRLKRARESGRIGSEKYETTLKEIHGHLFSFLDILKANFQPPPVIYRGVPKRSKLSRFLFGTIHFQLKKAGIMMDYQTVDALMMIIEQGLDKNFQESGSPELIFDFSQISLANRVLMRENANIFAETFIENSRTGATPFVEMDALYKSIRSVCPLWPFC